MCVSPVSRAPPRVHAAEASTKHTLLSSCSGRATCNVFSSASEIPPKVPHHAQSPVCACLILSVPPVPTIHVRSRGCQVVLAVQLLSETRALSPTCPQVPVPAGGKVQGRVQDPRILQSAAKCLLLKAPQASGQHSYFIGAGNSPRAGLGPDTLPPPQDAELLMRQTRFFLPSFESLGNSQRAGSRA